MKHNSKKVKLTAKDLDNFLYELMINAEIIALQSKKLKKHKKEAKL